MITSPSEPLRLVHVHRLAACEISSLKEAGFAGAESTVYGGGKRGHYGGEVAPSAWASRNQGLSLFSARLKQFEAWTQNVESAHKKNKVGISVKQQAPDIIQ